MGHHAPSLCKSIITQIFRCIFVQIASLTFSRNGGNKRKEVDTMKKKTYYYENRTFEVEVYSELCGSMLMIYIDEVIRPNRKFFGRTKYFYADDVIIDKYSSIDEAVKTVIAEGLEVEAYRKKVNEKWEEWNKKTN